MLVERFSEVGAFLAAAGPFLERHEAENNLALGLAGTLRDHPEIYPEPPLLAIARDGATIRAAALRTPPFGLVLSDGPGAALDALVDALIGAQESLPTVRAPRAAAYRFARRWREHTGATVTLEEESEILRLTRVDTPRPVRGDWRPAGPADAALIAAWLVAFAREDGETFEPTRLPGVVERWARRLDRTMYFWCLAGTPVCMAGVGGATTHGIKIGPVYTPPEWRRHGYASALVAAACRAELATGRIFCCLFVERHNEAARRIYRTLGFRPIVESRVYRFARPGL